MATIDLLDLDDLAPDDAHDAYDRRGLAAVPSASLIRAAGEVIARPKVAPADSFVLHAPLELLARACLLRYAAPGAKEAIRRRIVWLAATYAAAGPELAPPARVDRSGTIDEQCDRLVA